MNLNNTENAKVFKALCDEKRLSILEMLRQGEMCACKIQEQLTITQSTLSHHMKVLCDSGIIVGRKEGKWVYYSISAEGSAHAMELLKAITAVDESSVQSNSLCV